MFHPSPAVVHHHILLPFPLPLGLPLICIFIYIGDTPHRQHGLEAYKAAVAGGQLHEGWPLPGV